MEYTNSNIPKDVKSALSEIERKFVLMRSSGSSIRDIAKKLKKSTHTICDWNKKFHKELLEARNNIFSDIQKKVIDSKFSRLDFLRSEIDRISKILKKVNINESGYSDDYNKIFNYYARLSDLMSSYELDLFKVGVDFRNNLEPESNSIEKNEDKNINVADVAKKDNIDTEKSIKENTVNTEIKNEDNKTATNNNRATLPKKYFYKKQ